EWLVRTSASWRVDSSSRNSWPKRGFHIPLGRRSAVRERPRTAVPQPRGQRREACGAGFLGPNLGLGIHRYQPEMLAVAEGPLEVVEQAPGEVAPDVDAGPPCLVGSGYVR